MILRCLVPRTRGSCERCYTTIHGRGQQVWPLMGPHIHTSDPELVKQQG
jgi:hypothetical protein